MGICHPTFLVAHCALHLTLDLRFEKFLVYYSFSSFDWVFVDFNDKAVQSQRDVPDVTCFGLGKASTQIWRLVPKADPDPQRIIIAFSEGYDGR